MRVILLRWIDGVAAAATANADQDSLDAAKDLYASAAYEEALSTLSRLSEGGVSAPAVARQVDEYRAFCLYALGRTAEAESVAESTHPPRTAGGTGCRRRVAPARSDVRRRSEAPLARPHSRPVPDRPRTARSKAICGSRTPSRRGHGAC